MNNRILDGLEQIAVHLDLTALEHELDLLVLLTTEIAQHSGQRLERAMRGQEPQRADVVLQPATDAIQEVSVAAQPIVELGKDVEHLGPGRQAEAGAVAAAVAQS